MKKKSILFVLILMGSVFFSCLEKIEILPDSDRDALPDSREIKLGTDPEKKDTDGDGLSDYFETQKYLTNPLKADSDNDGTPDFDWDERREYTYTITAVIDLKQPYNIDHMNDFYQDARIIKRIDDEVERIEVVLYPLGKMIKTASPYKYDSALKPTYEKNFSEVMKSELAKKVKKYESDYSVVQALLRYMKFGFKFVSLSDLEYEPPLPLQFSFYKDDRGQIASAFLGKSEKYSIDEIMDQTYFADSMFARKTHGACSSMATLRGALLRAAGIREKSMLTIPLIYYYTTDNTDIAIKEEYNVGYPSLSGVIIANHVINTVYIGNQWFRVDEVIDTGIIQGNFKLPSVKILEFDDSTDYNFSRYWNYEQWEQSRPFKYISVRDQERIHG